MSRRNSRSPRVKDSDKGARSSAADQEDDRAGAFPRAQDKPRARWGPRDHRQVLCSLAFRPAGVPIDAPPPARTAGHLTGRMARPTGVGRATAGAQA